MNQRHSIKTLAGEPRVLVYEGNVVLEFEGDVESTTVGYEPPAQDLVSITLRPDQLDSLLAVIGRVDKSSISVDGHMHVRRLPTQ